MPPLKQTLVALSTTLITGAACAGALLGRDLDGNLANGYEAYYDTTLNISWLADANYAQTSGYSATGNMVWADAKAWAAQLDVNGVSGWRLPAMTPANQLCKHAWAYTNCSQNTDTSSSEMAYMFYVELGNLSHDDPISGWRPGASGVDWGIVNSGPFKNIGDSEYWSGSAYADPNYAGDAWYFSFYDGYQSFVIPNYEYKAWAVHDGDVGSSAKVPEPASLALVLTGLATVGLARRRRKPA